MTEVIPSHRAMRLAWCARCSRWRATVVRRDLERVFRHHKGCPNGGRFAPPPLKEIRDARPDPDADRSEP